MTIERGFTNPLAVVTKTVPTPTSIRPTYRTRNTNPITSYVTVYVSQFQSTSTGNRAFLRSGRFPRRPKSAKIQV